MIAKTLECGKQRFVDTETNFVTANPLEIHSFESAERFLTFLFILRGNTEATKIG
jgi:hypothetical protein